MKQIPLTQGKYALVDDADFDWLNQWKWFYLPQKHHTGYAVRETKKSEKRSLIWMHREVIGIAILETDHIDGDGLNNQRVNLRAATASQNQMNRSKNRRSTSTFKGVSWNKHRKRWAAQIQINKKVICLGYYVDECEAAKAYNSAALKYHGEFARLNAI